MTLKIARLLVLAFAPALVQATPCRLMLADQSDWNAKRGVYVDLENDVPASGGPCRLSTMSLAMGVADGSTWRFAVQYPAWQLNRDYTVKAVVQNGSFELWLDGNLLQRSPAGFVTNPGGKLAAGAVPSWANGAGDYVVVQTGLTIVSSTGQSATADFADATRALVLMLFAPGSPKTINWSATGSQTWTITATFHIFPAPDLKALAPIIDRYGQSRHASWDGKITSDDDLAAAALLETGKLQTWGAPSGFDQYGGLLNTGWSRPATGYFSLAQRNGLWWLVTPLGNPCFYIGIDTAPAYNWDRTPVTGRVANYFAELPPAVDPWSAAWGLNSWGQNDGTVDVSFNTVNMIRKYGAGWHDTETDLTVKRIKAWGFSGLGKWADFVTGQPVIPVLGHYNTPNVVRHPDVFDPQVLTAFRNDLATQIAPHTSDPYVVGWSLGNEYDEIITAAETTSMLNLGSSVPAKRALVDEALANLYSGDVAKMAAAWSVRASSKNDLYAAKPFPPAADLEHLRQYYAGQYYGYIYQTVKALDPNHLYFGFWIVPGWWENENDWRVAAKYCDVIGYDRYNEQFVDSTLDRLVRETAKPILAGEFSYPATYNLTRGFREYGVSALDDAASGVKYARWMRDAQRNPFCIGVAWFQYRDEPVSGRGPGQGTDIVYGESFAFGLVDVGDRPKYDLVERVRTANLAAANGRLQYVPPVLSDGGTVNAATFQAPVAPGGLMSVFGTALEGATLRTGDTTVPVLFSAGNQINAQVPWEAAGQTTMQLVVSNGNIIDVPLAAYAPGIFAVTSASDGSLTVKAGGYITIWANGLGPTKNQPPTGAASPSDAANLATTLTTPTVTIGSETALVVFSGLSPGWIGLYQVNAQVPAGTKPGAAVAVQIAIGGKTSNTSSIAVQ